MEFDFCHLDTWVVLVAGEILHASSAKGLSMIWSLSLMASRVVAVSSFLTLSSKV